MKNTNDFHYEGKPSHATAKSTSFAVSEDEWDKMEDTGNHEECIVLTAVCQKAPFRLKRRQTVKNQAHSLSRYRVTLV